MRQTYRRRDQALWRSIPDGVVLLPPAGNDPVAVRGPGQALWAALDEHRTVEDLVERLAAGFGAAPEQVDQEVRQLLDHLVSMGVVEVETWRSTA